MVIKRFYGGMVKMGVLDFNRDDTLGTVESVDTSTVVIRVGCKLIICFQFKARELGNN